MFKLMKYEFRKQFLSKIVILAIVAVLELMFIYGVIAKNTDTIASAVGIFMALAVIATMYVSFECAFTYSRDLKTKQSYMLFLTPNSAYGVVGAKVLATIVQVFLTGAVFAGVIIANILFMAARYHGVKEVIEVVQQFFREAVHLDIQMDLIVSTLVYLMVYWILLIIIAMFAITLTYTFLANTRLKELVSIVLFFVILWGVDKISDAILPDLAHITSYVMLGGAGICIVLTALFYLGTAWMLDKKVSL
ncbi:MAG: hypothetical protein E7256_00190 [Lachnospiraceae bacterium]|nr:hypothetical protein [Lachnospiraceae bacterium]